MKNIKKLMALALIGTGIALASPIEANAAWKVNDKGWWYTEGNSWATGWRKIGGAWYYFYSNGYMAHDTTIDGYYVNSYGEYEPNHSSKKVSNGKEIQSGTYKVGRDIPAGEYVVLAGEYYGYYECTSDTSGDLDSVIYNGVLFENETAYVTVNSGEYLKIEDAVMYKVSEAPLKYMKYNKSFNDEEHRKAWLLKVTLNTSKTLLMSAWFRKTAVMEEADDIVTELNEKSEVYYAVLKLPAKYRQIVHLFYYEDMSVESISKITGIKPSTIKSQLHRARLMMKELLKEEADFV